MTDLVKQAQQYAQQALGKKGLITRKAYCGAHQQWSSQFQGVDEHGWLFRCANSKLHMSHLFHAKAPVGVPTQNLEAAERWIHEQQLAAVAKQTGQDRGQ